MAIFLISQQNHAADIKYMAILRAELHVKIDALKSNDSGVDPLFNVRVVGPGFDSEWVSLCRTNIFSLLNTTAVMQLAVRWNTI